MNDRTELFTIGQLASRTGVPVRTVRFWSDLGLVEPAGRSAGGYRLYGADAVGRLDLVRTLRELGLDLETVQRVLRGQDTVAGVAKAHADALDAEIRILRVRRAVLRSVARRGSSAEEMRIMNEMARLSAEERQRVIDEFVDRTFAGIAPEAPGAQIAQGMRIMPARLPDDPTAEQVDAWVELAELVADDGFRQRVRQMAMAGADGDAQPGLQVDHEAVLEQAGAAMAAGVEPGSAEGQAVVGRLIPAGTTAADRARAADQLDLFSDRRVERYWQLMGVLNGRPPFPAQVPAFEWFIAALRAQGTSR